jgi:hypothetical protein
MLVDVHNSKLVGQMHPVLQMLTLKIAAQVIGKLGVLEFSVLHNQPTTEMSQD